MSARCPAQQTLLPSQPATNPNHLLFSPYQNQNHSLSLSPPLHSTDTNPKSLQKACTPLSKKTIFSPDALNPSQPGDPACQRLSHNSTMHRNLVIFLIIVLIFVLLTLFGIGIWMLTRPTGAKELGSSTSSSSHSILIAEA
ncbi:hypothetical protein K470DRAFT_68727 [Piedraia hortae CBS 480.64]|uniref:Uncharacterized protein n=1 Tax=Piedraia hortae CBS 480.64 TaxID=1314780 RepID=A0A6A7BZC9_9PEZI|nr:hypothetical protein K470DRAFT_68727 [Piedraia hortae CBS 480.64]